MSNKRVRSDTVSCYRCGKKSHDANSCRFKNECCFRCGKRGHIAAVCRGSRQEPEEANEDHKRLQLPRSREPRQQRRPSRHVRFMKHHQGDQEDSNSDSDDLKIKQIFVIGMKSASGPFEVEMSLNDQPIRMEVDTGAAVSIISQAQFRQLLPGERVMTSDIRLKTYTGQPMEVIGESMVKVAHNQQSELLPIVIVADEGPPLIGRNWLRKIRLDWKTIGAVAKSSESSKQSLQKLLSKYAALFQDEAGTIESCEAKLYLKSEAKPKFFKPRPVPFALKSAVDQELDRLEAAGIIQSVPTSEWAAPIVVVPKKDGQIRLCGDYKVTCNPQIDVEQYPLPRPQDMFATLSGGQKFTKLDLRQAYFQLPLEESSRKYVTINTHRGLYEYTRLPFGVSSAPALFQKTMDTILQGLPGVTCYIDDILVTGANDQEHLQNLEQVLERLSHQGMRLKESKCSFLMPSVDYLGHRIDASGLHPTSEKLEAVLKAPTPRNLKELRSFLGLINYYGAFIPNLSSFLQPLHALLQKDTRWKWTEQCDQSFKAAKDSLTSPPVLVHYNPKLPLRVAADASSHGLGALLSHVMPDQSERPIAFASRTLSSSEKKFAQVEKEALALVFAIKKFHLYLYGRTFTLFTDHKPLLTILGPKKAIPTLAAARLQRWALLLASYTYEIEYKSSQRHSNADALSRLPLPQAEPKYDSMVAPDVFSCLNMSQVEALPVTAKAIQKASRIDPVLSKVILYTRKGWPSTVRDVFKPYYHRRNELTVEEDCLLWGTRIIIPSALRSSILEDLHRDHPGVVRMKAMARSYLWWPKLDKEIEQCEKQCDHCQAVKGHPPSAPLHPWIWPDRPWQRVHLDFAGPFCEKMFLICVDAHSKWPEVIEMSKTTATRTIAELRKLFAANGLPEQNIIVTDNGPQFTSDEFSLFLRSNGVKHIRCSPYHPASNGLAERFVRTFKEAMKAGRADSLPLQHRLANFLLTYRTTPHATTNEPPCVLFQGRHLRTRLDLLRPDRERTVANKQAHQKSQHDQHSRYRDIAVGQRVFARNLQPRLPWLPGRVISSLGPVSVLIKLEDGRVWKRHIDHVKVASSGEDFSDIQASAGSDISMESDEECQSGKESVKSEDSDSPPAPENSSVSPSHSTVDSTPPAAPMPTLRRSTRQRTVPKRFADYTKHS